MNSLELRKDPSSGERIVMYGFEEQWLKDVKERSCYSDQVLYSGTKEELIEKPEEWWKGIVEEDPYIFAYKGYGELGLPFYRAKESGLSAIESTKGNHILIVRERI